MCIISGHKDDRVMIFIDLRNMSYSVREYSAFSKLDYVKMVSLINQSRNLRRAYVFDGLDITEGIRSNKFHDYLRYNNFTVETNEIYDPATCGQKGVDVSLACTVMFLASQDEFDTAIIVSGDGDFIPLVNMIKRMGKRVEVAAFDESCNEGMRKVADRFHELDTMPLLEMESAFEEICGAATMADAAAEVM